MAIKERWEKRFFLSLILWNESPFALVDRFPIIPSLGYRAHINVLWTWSLWIHSMYNEITDINRSIKFKLTLVSTSVFNIPVCTWTLPLLLPLKLLIDGGVFLSEERIYYCDSTQVDDGCGSATIIIENRVQHPPQPQEEWRTDVDFMMMNAPRNLVLSGRETRGGGGGHWMGS